MTAKKKATKKDSKKVTTKNAPRKLRDYMLAKLGGEEQVKADFAREQLKSLPPAMTIQEAFDKATKEGWGDEFRTTPLSVFRSRTSSKPRAKRRKNVPYANVLAGVQEHLKKGRTYQAAGVAKELGYPATAVRKALAAMIAQGKVTKKGKARGAVFSLV